MFYVIFLSPQVKRCAISTYKHGIYELPNELLHEIRLRKCQLLHGIFVDGGGSMPTQEKKKDLGKIRGKIRRVSKLHRMTA